MHMDKEIVSLSHLNVLALGDRLAASYMSIRDVLDSFGEVTFKSEKGYEHPEEFIDFLRTTSCNVVLMPNPYGNENRLRIYQSLKSRGFPVIAWDRGGLPNSWFFDRGFNADSETYRPLNWDTPLSEEQRRNIRGYLEELSTKQKPLEAQGARLGGEALRTRLGLEGKKILFVPFQRPSDTTIRYFSGAVGSYANFVAKIEEISLLAEKHCPDWVVIGKRHPLETADPSSRVIMVPHDAHVNDLLEMCDAVALVNSGVGLLAAAFNKPVYYFGQTYYGHPKLNRHVTSADEVVIEMRNGPMTVDGDVRDRLYHYLRYSIYSFGESHMELVPQNDGSLRNITRRVDFSEVRLPADTYRAKKKFSLSLR